MGYLLKLLFSKNMSWTWATCPSLVGQVLSFPLLLNSDLRSSVDQARLNVENSTIYVEDALPNPKDNFDPKVLMDFGLKEALVHKKLPYVSVNVVEKLVDQPIKIDDFRSGENYI